MTERDIEISCLCLKMTRAECLGYLVAVWYINPCSGAIYVNWVGRWKMALFALKWFSIRPLNSSFRHRQRLGYWSYMLFMMSDKFLREYRSPVAHSKIGNLLCFLPRCLSKSAGYEPQNAPISFQHMPYMYRRIVDLFWRAVRRKGRTFIGSLSLTNICQRSPLLRTGQVRLRRPSHASRVLPIHVASFLWSRYASSRAERDL